MVKLILAIQYPRFMLINLSNEDQSRLACHPQTMREQNALRISVTNKKSMMLIEQFKFIKSGVLFSQSPF